MLRQKHAAVTRDARTRKAAWGPNWALRRSQVDASKALLRAITREMAGGMVASLGLSQAHTVEAACPDHVAITTLLSESFAAAISKADGAAGGHGGGSDGGGGVEGGVPGGGCSGGAGGDGGGGSGGMKSKQQPEQSHHWGML